MYQIQHRNAFLVIVQCVYANLISVKFVRIKLSDFDPISLLILLANHARMLNINLFLISNMLDKF